MPAAPIIAGVGLAVGVASTVASISASNKQAKYQRQALKYQRQSDNIKAAKERKDAIRAARLASGTALQVAANQGAMDTSASLGGLGSITSQLNQNLSFLDQTSTLADQASVSIGKANKQGANAAMFGQIADLGFMVAGKSKNIASVFGS